jgi:tyrocidine synthetase-3
MDVKSLLKKLRDRHIHISLSGENLQVSSDDPELPSDLLQEIRSGKAAIIGYLKSQHSDSVPSASIPRIASSDEGYVLSSSQYRLWLLCRLSNASVAYNIPGVFQFEGSLDMEAFSASFNAIVERHENIRTVFREDGEGRPRQYVKTAEELGLSIRTRDLRQEPSREELAKELVQQEMLTSMDLASGPLLTATLYRIEDNKWIFVYVMHHIITDGWSMGVLFTELIRLYNARVRKERSPLQPLRIQYRDYASWQQEQLGSGGMEAHRNYWMKQFEGELPVLELPSDRPRPAVKTYNGGDVKGMIGAKLGKELKELCQRQGGTLFMGLLAAVKALFYRYAGHEDITIGSPIAGRQHADLEEQIGFYVNTLALRSRFSGAKGFIELLKEVKQVTLDAYEHEVYPFDELVGALNLRHDMSRSPLFDVMVVLQNNDVNKDLKLSLEELNISTCYHDEETSVSKFDLVFTFVEGPAGISTAIEYNTDIYRKSSVERMGAHLEQLLAALVAQPERPLRELDYLREDEKRRLVVEFNDTSITYPRDKTIVELFAEQAQKAPERTALVFEEREWSYRELHEKSNQLAHYLKNNYNVQPGGMVGVMLDRSDRLIIAILAALKAGAAYVPIDIDYPDARKEFIIKDTGLTALITQNEFTSGLGNYEGGIFLMDVQLDTLAASVETPEVTATPSSVAYVMYTSGSTGNPKGVMVPHRGVVRLVKSPDYVNLTGEEVLLAVGSVSFDAATFEYWSMLLNGGQLVMSRKEAVLDTGLLAQEIKERKVTTMLFTTGWLNQLIDEHVEVFEGLETLLTGGDKISPQHIKKLRGRYPQMRIVNGYGPTENTTFSLTHNIGTVQENIPIGKPLSNSTAYILDAQQQLVPVGVVGEICVGGDGLANGYLNNPALTADKFILHSLPFIGETRLYKTGDLGKWTEDGVVEFLGRRDAQVKIRGYRIELGEIEAALLGCDNISSAVVIARSTPGGEKELAAYIVGNGDLDVSAIRACLGRILPGYMRPSHLIQLPELPLTSSGKVDYKRLPEPGDLGLSSGVEYIAPRNQTEEKLVAIWQDILGKETVGVKDDFFELGGHSLRASRLANQVHRVFEVKLSLNTFFEKPTLEEQARVIAQSIKTGYLDIEKAPHKEYYPLSSAQKRIFFLQEFAPQSSSYNIPMVNYLGREVDPERIATVLRQLIARHESLRTSFEKIDGAVMQKIHSDAPFELDTHECLPQNFDAYLQSYIRPFNLAQAPLLRSSLVHVTGVGFAWIVDIHHIISDGTSQQVLTDDFLRLYRGENLPELRLQYRDFSEWQNGLQQSGELEKQKEYWRSQFTGSVSRLNLPADRPRPSAFSFEGDVHNFVLDKELTAQVRAFCRQTHGTLQMALLSALNVLFHRYSGQQDITIGCGIAGRRHPDLERIVGMFVNTLAIRNYPEAEKTFGQFYKEVSAACLAAYDNQDVQFEDLVDMLQVERDPSANPIFDVTLVVQNFVQSQEDKSVLLTEAEEAEEAPELSHQGNRTAKFDMSWFVFELEEDIYINLEYYSAIFDASTIERMVRHFTNVLRAAVSAPSATLAQVQVLSVDEQQLLLQEYVDGGQPEFAGTSLHELFEKQSLLTPDAIALISGDASYTYKELSGQSNQLAHFLTSTGLKKGDPVGVLQSRNKDLVVSLLAILKAGGVYVPLDSDYPEERLLYMLQDTGAEVLLTSSGLIELGNRLQWREKGIKHLVCVDSSSIYSERGMLRNELMRKDLWDHVGETATDAISAGGWMSSYTGEYISAEEMQEYSDNAFLKLRPYLRKDMKVLEIGCSSGLTMFQVAPHVGAYHGTDLSSSILEGTRKEAQEHGYNHITFTCLPAHNIHQLDDEGFDLVIINSVIQSFDGHNYLRDVLVKVLAKMNDTGLLFIGDIMDEDRRQALIDDLNAFGEANEGKGYRTKTSVSDELFISREYLDDLVADGIGIASGEYTGKIYTIPNELTEFRFDALLQVDKKQSIQKPKKRHQYDLNHISAQDTATVSITNDAGDTAYVIYTSGSTGKPKGVMVAHANIAAFLDKCRRQFGSNGTVSMPVLASNAFDISLFETFLPLITGGAVLMLDSSQVKDTAYLLEQLKRATAFHAVPALMAQVTTHIIENGITSEYAQITDVYTGGDAVPTTVLSGLRKAFPQARIHVLYGPTESTIFVTSKLYHPGQEDFKGSLIGSPDTHARVYITDASGQLAPIGVAGEICIGGSIVSKGYLNQPELTAEKFTEDPFHKGAVIYRSGDLGRWLPDGGIEFLGRKDNQVKIRGYRIELGEVENALRRHSSVQEAVVVKNTREGDHSLVAYVVSNGAITTADLRNHLGKSLPAYMVPSHFVQLETLPLTSNGKVDRKKLPDPHAAGMASGTAYVAPRTQTEERLALVWQELLGKEKIGAKDNFFESGGHSLKATRLTNHIQKTFEVSVELKDLFLHPVLEDQARLIDQAAAASFTAIPLVAQQESYVLSSSQRRLWMMSQFPEANVANNMPGAYIFEGNFDHKYLEAAFLSLIERHESLRTVFRMNEQGEVRQFIKPAWASGFALRYLDLRNDTRGEELVREMVHADFATPFDISSGPLLRASIYQVEDNKWVFNYVMHHIISDGWSINILVGELFRLYHAYSKGETLVLPPLRKQYKDYAAWQQQQLSGENLEAHKNYWLKQFEGELPVLALPGDKPRPAVKTYTGRDIHFYFDGEQTSAFKELVQQQGGTLFMGILAAVNTLLYRYTGQEDIIIGSPIAGRSHADLEDQIGYYLNTIVLRSRFSGNDNFRQLLDHVKQVTLGAYEHQVYPFDELVGNLNLRPDMSRSALFDVLVVMQNNETDGGNVVASIDGFKASSFGGEVLIAKFDLAFDFTEGKNGLVLRLRYNSDIYERETIAAMGRHLQQLLSCISSEPQKSLAQLEYLGQEDKLQLLHGFNDTAVEYPQEKTIVHLFEEQAAKLPNEPAVVSGGRTLTYKELDESSSQLAHYLRSHYNIHPGDLVAVQLGRSEKMIVALLAVLKSGGAYLPIDPEYPQERIHYMISDSNCKLVINEDLLESFSREQEEHGSENLSFPSLLPSQLAYVIYTSGSTGRPKGVMIEHKAIANTIQAKQSRIGVQQGERCLQFAPISFDASVYEIFIALCNGAVLHIASEEARKDPLALEQYIAKHGIDMLTLPPALLKIVEPENLRSLKRLLTGGEAATPDLLGSYDGDYFNCYGPTETAICVSIFQGKGGELKPGIVPLGKPIPNVQVHIVDTRMALVPVGVVGEICVSGAGLARGYLNNPELTVEKFTTEHKIEGIGRVYKTGDLGRWLLNGDIEFVGRKDRQVKVRGYRIELGEIESALQSIEGITAAAVDAREGKDGKELVAYIVSQQQQNETELREQLSKLLPAFMVPGYFVQLEQLPLTPNDKTDYKALPDPAGLGIETSAEYVAPRNETEEKLALIWQEVLGRNTVSVKDNFFKLGGHSLKATRLAGLVHKEFQVKIELKNLFDVTVLEDQARMIGNSAKTSFDSIAAMEQPGDYVLSSSQRRLWILSRFEEANRAYNMPGVCIFEGKLDHNALEAAFGSLIERHESLRTTFRENEHGEARQVIHPATASGFTLHYLDLRNNTNREQSVKDLVQGDFSRPFDLSSGPLLRASLYQVGDSKWVFSYVMHHIISDGWSMNILVSELLQLYRAHANGEAASLAPLRIQYKDYAAWQQQQLTGESLKAHKEYWLKQFEGELPVLELSGDNPRPAVKTYNGRTTSLHINAELGRGLRALSQQQGGTLFMGILAAINTLLYRYTAQEDIIIGSPIAGREHADLEGQIGFYLNTLALRSRFSGGDSFHQLLGHVKQVTLDAYQHHVYPFDELVDNLDLQRDMSRSALFDVMVILQNNESDGGNALENIGDLSVNHYEGGEVLISKFDLEFNFIEVGEGLHLMLAYNSDIYTASTIERLTRHLEQLLYAITRDPLKPIKQLDYLDKEEKRQLLSTFNHTSVDYPRDKTIVQLFAEQAEKTPDRIALAYEGSEMSYRELHERSNQLAHYLKENHDIQPDDMIGIMLDRSDKTIIAILGVLKSGAAYVPIDADYPDVRKEFIMKDTGIKALITQSEFIFDLAYFAGGVFAMDLQLDTLETSTQMPELSIVPANLAYVMYTSGSTGNPKGVMVEHRSVVRLVKNTNYVNLTGEEVLLSTGAVSFDATTFEFWAMLLNGGQLVMSRKEVLLDNSLLLQEISRRKVDMMWFTTGWLNQVVDESMEIFEGVKTVLSGGDKISRLHIQKLRARYPQMQFVNCYGPTENTTFSLTYNVESVQENIPIGKPISNSTAFILDAQHQVVPVGVVGEICVGGDGLARGYLNNQELAADKFITADLPFIGETRIYKTGDLGRWREDGNIEFIGRRDAQVKIRGFRVELGEIENTLQSHPAVDAAVVIAMQHGEEKELVAYVVGGEELNAADMAAYLDGILPSYMVPAHFVQMNELPLNANGKVDRKQLPDPGTGSLLSAVEYIAPRNEVEEKLVSVWKDILGKETISVKDNFFDLGGHSLRVTRLASQLHKEFNVRIELKDLFEVAVLEDLARLVGQSARSSFAMIEPVEQQADYALSSSQRRLWVLSQFEEGNVAYNMPGVHLFEGNLDSEALEAAFASLVERHESLRTVFRENEKGEVRQVIHSPAEAGFILNALDLRNDIHRGQMVSGLVQDDFVKPFDLSAGPLLRASLYRIEDGKWVFSYVMHHIISDGWSMNILIRELLQFYNAHAKGQGNPLEPLRIQYKDYAAWQQQQLNGENLETHKQYWLKQFEGELPVLELPASRPRPAAKTYNGKHTHLTLNAELGQGLKALSQQQGGTLFMGVLAAVKALLYRYTAQEDIIIGSPIAGREHADLEGQIGFYLNTLALRSRFSGSGSFRQLLDHVKQVTLDAYEHQVYPFDELVEALNLRRDMSRSALFDVMVVLQNNESDGGNVLQSIDSFSVSGYGGGGEFLVSKFDLEFDFIEIGGELHLTLRYNSDIYSPSAMERLALHLEQILSAIIREPQKPVAQLDYMKEEEAQQLLVGFNDTSVDYPRDKTLVELFAAQAEKTPERTALAFEGSEMSYRELHERSNQLAHYLKENHNIQPDDMIGIMLDRSDKTIIAILGVLKSGAAYVPIDVDYPDTRKEFIMKDTGIKALITQSDFIFDLGYFDGGVFAMDLQLDTLETSTQMPELSITPASLAYVMYTSGSTGNPKGVMVEHRSVVRLVKNTNYINLTGDEVMVSTGAVSFDATSFEFWAMLLNGGQLVMSRKEVLLDNSLLLREVRSRKANVLWFTTGWLNQVVDENMEIFEGIRTVLSGGEKISRPHIQKLRDRYPQMQFVHCYGPTENTGFSLACDIEEIGEVIPIGKPISNSTVFVLDAQHQPVPVGVAGEICVGGDGLARGYLNNPELTADKFITVNLPLIGETRIYKTGDLGRWTPDGLIEFIGRRDAQVKIRGFRIELGEIESALQSHPAVDSAVVIARESGAEKEVVAYVVGREELDAADLSAYLGGTLPSYMVPAHFMQLDELPLNANGKVDRKRLPDPTTGSLLSAVEYIAPRNEVEEKLVAIWKDILGKDTISVKDNFFDLGGHSLRVTRLASQVHREFNVKIELKDLFEVAVLEDLATLIEQSVKTSFDKIEPVEPQADYALSSSQRRLWVLSQFEEANIAYNMPGVHMFEGGFSPKALEAAFASLIERHESLRTVFRENEQGDIRQIILPSNASGFSLTQLDLRHDKRQEEAVRELVQGDFVKPFDLSSGPLLRASLYQVEDSRWVFSYVMHHIISDGWSMNILIRELLQFYNAHAKGGGNPLEPLRIQYKDYAAWQQKQLTGESLKAHEDYWLKQFEGEIPVLDLPGDNPRPAVKTHNGRRMHFGLNAELAQGIKNLSQQQGGTLFMGLLAAVNTLLYRYTSQEDIVIGSPIAGREHADLEGQIGFYLNTLALRSRFSGNGSFQQLLDHVKRVTLDAYQHQVYPFDELVENLSLRRDMSRSALFDVMVILQNNESDGGDVLLDIDNLSVSGYGGGEITVSKFDLVFEFMEVGEELHAVLGYNTDIYGEDTIKRMADHLRQLLSSLVREPQKPLAQLDYLGDGEEQELLRKFNDTAVTFPQDKTIIHLFEEQAERTPGEPAVVFGRRTLTYKQLNAQANRLAHYLKTNYSITPDDLIAIKLERSERMIATLLGILKSGGAYLPIDPEYPQERIGYMISDSGCKLVIDEEFLESFERKQEKYSKENLASSNLLPSHLAYVIYTSGSTGKPKGVMMEHGSVLNYLLGFRHRHSVDVDFLFTSNVAFDASLKQIFLPLISGRKVHVYNLLRDLSSLPEYVRKNSVRVLNATPGVVNELLGLPDGRRLFETLETVIIGGEAFDPALLQKMRAYNPGLVITNAYGPTETCANSLTCELDSRVSLGTPLPNTSIYLLDANGMLVPVGVVGEICIGGPGLARGYLNRAELTAEKFVENPYKPGTRMYMTGDLGRWLPDGTIEFIGRKDDQVKIRGHRIELGEIENALRGMEAIASAAVTARATDNGGKELVAYIVAKEELAAAAIRSSLSGLLPAYMIPTHFVQMDELPLTSNGKVDRKRLPEPDSDALERTSYIAPRNEAEERMALAWQEALGRKQVGIGDNFFDLGGHSLNAIRLQRLLNKKYGFRIGIRDIYNHPTIEELLTASPGSSKLVQLGTGQPGAQRIYMIPPILGNAIVYKPLADKLKELNSYGFQYSGLESDEPLYTSVEQAAQEFSAEIMRKEQDGNFVLLGYSMGAVIAFEMTRILEEQFGPIRLVLVDRPPVNAEPEAMPDEASMSRHLDWLVEQYKAFTGDVHADAESLKRFLFNNMEIMQKYRQTGRIKSDIQALECKERRPVSMKDWADYTEGKLKHRYIKGTHWEALFPANLPLLEKAVRG